MVFVLSFLNIVPHVVAAVHNRSVHASGQDMLSAVICSLAVLAVGVTRLYKIKSEYTRLNTKQDWKGESEVVRA